MVFHDDEHIENLILSAIWLWVGVILFAYFFDIYIAIALGVIISALIIHGLRSRIKIWRQSADNEPKTDEDEDDTKKILLFIFGVVSPILGLVVLFISHSFIGFLMGAIVPVVFYLQSNEKENARDSNYYDNIFVKIYIQLAASVIRVDNKTPDEEFKKFAKYIQKEFSYRHVASDLKLLKRYMTSEIKLKQICRELRNFPTNQRIQMLYQLLVIANADKTITATEDDLIQQIATLIEIPTSTYRKIRAMFANTETHEQQKSNNSEIIFRPNISIQYQILGVSQTATNDEVKHAYYQMAKEHHPDLVTHLGEPFITQAQDMFQKINSAYDAIKKERNMN